MTIGTFLVLQNAQPGRDQDHTDWYLSDHLADVGEVPGMIRGTYATADEGQWRHLGYYLIDGEPGPVFEEVLRRSFSGAWKLADTLDFRGMMRSIGVQRGGFVRDGAAQYVFVLLVNPFDADAAVLLDWSASPAFAEAVSLPHVKAARIFELVPHAEIKKAYPYRFALVCDLASGDAAGELKARVLDAMDGLIQPDVLRAFYTVRGVTGA